MTFSEKLEFEQSLSKNSRVLVVNPLSSIWSHEITAEAALRAFDVTNHVFWLNASTNLPKNFQINYKDFLPRWYFKNLSKALARILCSRGMKADGNSIRINRRLDVPYFKNIDELKAFQKDNLRIGAMIYSAIASNRGTTSFSMIEIATHCNHLFKYSDAARAHIRRAILDFKPTLILTTNDRLISAAMAVALAREFKIESRVVYWGSESNTIQDYLNSLYDGTEWQIQTELKWKVSPPNELELKELQTELSIIGNEPSKDSRTYLHGQALGNVPDLPEKCIVFYAQSEHEHSPNLFNSHQHRFSNQYEAFDHLQKVARDLGWMVYLKYHPLKDLPALAKGIKVENIDWSSIELLDNVTEISPTSDIDTYALIGQSGLNVVWSSTVGLESILRHRPTLVLGNPHWLNTNWNIHAWNESAIMHHLLNHQRVLNQDALLPWYWFLKGYGSSFRFSTREQQGLKVSGSQVLKVRFYIVVMRAIKRLWKTVSR